MKRTLIIGLIATTLLTGCSWFRTKPAATPTPEPKAPAPAATSQPSPAGTVSAPVPTLVLEYLRQGARSPDGKWVAAISPGAGEAGGLWLAKSDLSDPTRIATGISVQSGLPRWAPSGALLYASEGGNITWFAYDLGTGQSREFLPTLLKGKAADVGPDAFSPDGKQFIYSIGSGEAMEVWVAGIDGTGARKLGTNVRARWVDGQLQITQVGK